MTADEPLSMMRSGAQMSLSTDSGVITDSASLDTVSPTIIAQQHEPYSSSHYNAVVDPSTVVLDVGVNDVVTPPEMSAMPNGLLRPQMCIAPLRISINERVDRAGVSTDSSTTSNPPSFPRHGRHGYAGFKNLGEDGGASSSTGGVTAVNTMTKPNTSAADKCIEREDVVRLLHNLRQRRHEQRVNPEEPRVQRKINAPRMPSPVPTEHREQALVVLLDKLDHKHVHKHKQLDGVGVLLQQMRVANAQGEEHILSLPLVQTIHIDRGGEQWVSSADGVEPMDASSTYQRPAEGTSDQPSKRKGGSADLSTEDRALRRIVRSKMHRCKRCKNRFIERGIYERHMKLRHYEDYVVYMARQEEEMEAHRAAETEAMRVEEITTGGFIPPAVDVEASGFEVVPGEIPLPGEQFGGKLPRFDCYGGLVVPRRQFVKKISPQCPFCDKRFRNEVSLANHICKKHEECIDYVQCNVCYKCLRSREHLAVHDCSLEFMCIECVPIRNLCTEARLMAHRLKFHRGAKSGFQCTDCNQKFLTPRKLRKHKKMSHVVSKPHKCYWCDEFFINDTQVALHERVHTGISKFECSICDYRVNRYMKMGLHLKHEHGYVCSVCKQKVADRDTLLCHVQEEHGGYMAQQRQHHYVESPRVWLAFKGE